MAPDTRRWQSGLMHLPSKQTTEVREFESHTPLQNRENGNSLFGRFVQRRGTPAQKVGVLISDAILRSIMELADILQVTVSEVPPEEYVGQPLEARVQLLPSVHASEESADDLATFLTAKDGLELCQRYFVSGNLAQTAREMQIRYPVALRTLRESWFQEELVSLEHQLKIRQRAIRDELIDDTLKQLRDRLKNGDEVVTKDGIVTVGVKARDLASIAAILSDQREKYDEATKPAGGAPKGKLETLADQLRAKVAGATTIEAKQVGHGS